jgi:hypothetical protein
MTDKKVEQLNREYFDDLLNQPEENVDHEIAGLMLDDEMMEGLSEFHPANDAYNLELVRILREIQRRQPHLEPKELLALEHLVRGKSLVEIKEQHGVALTQDDLTGIKVRQMAQLVSSLYLLRLGVTKKQRANMLWRIAVRNEIKRPDLAISAVATINKMFGDNSPVRNGISGGSDSGITIIVQNQALANSPLDAAEE